MAPPAKKPTAVAPAAPPLQLSSVDDLTRLADVLFAGGIVPNGVGRKETLAAIILMGYEVGLSPVQACQSIMVANGRLTIWGDAMLALVRRSGLLESIVEKIDGDGDNRRATCTVKRNGEQERTVTYSVADAKRAGLWGKKGSWQTAPDRMLMFRARGYAIRDVFPDVLCGLAAGDADDVAPQPATDVIVEVVTPPTPVPPPTAAPPVAVPPPSSPPPAEVPPPSPPKPSDDSPITEELLREIAKHREPFILRTTGVKAADKDAFAAEWTKVLEQFGVTSAKQLTYGQGKQLYVMMLPPGEREVEQMRQFF